MKSAQTFVGLMTLFVNFPVTLYLSWLLYSHVHATDLMWFLWYFSMGLNLLTQITMAVSKRS